MANASIFGALSTFLVIAPVLYRNYHDSLRPSGMTSPRIAFRGVNRWIAGKNLMA
jgi:hypothetical protein